MIKDLTKWHKKFAWLPVTIRGNVLWLKTYERRLVLPEWFYQCEYWEYRW